MTHLALKGGDKTCAHAWPRWPVWGTEEREALLGVLESGQWWYGEKVREFEARFAEFQGARYGVTCTSGTTALETILFALGIGSGDEVIVPPYTFMATASAVLRVGAIPVFADIQPDTLCIDPVAVVQKVTTRTKAIIPVHLAGYVADMDRLGEIARSHSLFVVEDACHAWGSQWHGKGVGALGHGGVFSFQASKNITSAEGGIILTDDETLTDLCRSFTNCGRRKDKAWYQHFIVSSNLRITEFQAAMLLAQLSRLEAQTRRRQVSAKILDDGLREIPGIVVLRDDPRMTRRAYHFYPFRLDTSSLGVSRDRFVEALVAEGVPASIGYPYPLYKNPLFEHGDDYNSESTRCPVCEEVCADAVWISHPILLADAEVIQTVVDAVRKVCQYREELR